MEKTKYYRHCNGDAPMSDWGHALFADTPDRTDYYGAVMWSVETDNYIGDYLDTLWDLWRQDKEAGLLHDYDCDYLEDMNYDEFCAAINPSDIVDTAGAWDCWELTKWFFDRFAEPRNLMSFATQDGAVSFDSTVIKKEN